MLLRGISNTDPDKGAVSLPLSEYLKRYHNEWVAGMPGRTYPGGTLTDIVNKFTMMTAGKDAYRWEDRYMPVIVNHHSRGWGSGLNAYIFWSHRDRCLRIVVL
jgi:hypothetical protein